MSRQPKKIERTDTENYFISETVARRRFLQAVGAGATVPALSGVGQARESLPSSRGDGHGGDDFIWQLIKEFFGDRLVRPRFGYSALVDEKPPVEPDHEVELLARPPAAEGAPPEFIFEPTGLFIEPGDTVQFTTKQEIHTITSYHPDLGYKRRIPENAPPISSPVVWPDTYFLYTFEQEGVYDLVCIPHEFLGMVVRIVAGSATGPGAEPVASPAEEEPANVPEQEEPYPPFGAAATVLDDPALDPERIIEQGSVSWDEIADESKQPPEESEG